MRTLIKLKAAPKNTAPNNGMLVTGFPALHPNCQGFGGRAIVSVHLRPVSTPSLRSVGHSPQVHGTQAQIKLATSTCLNVVCNACRKGKKAGRAKAKPNAKYIKLKILSQVRKT